VVYGAGRVCEWRHGDATLGGHHWPVGWSGGELVIAYEYTLTFFDPSTLSPLTIASSRIGVGK